MTNDEKYIINALLEYELEQEEQVFIDFHLLAEHQDMTEEQHNKLIGMYEKYVGLGFEGNEIHEQ